MSAQRTVSPTPRRISLLKRLSLHARFDKSSPRCGEEDDDDGPPQDGAAAPERRRATNGDAVRHRRATVDAAPPRCFARLRDGVAVQERRRRTNDGEVHCRRATVEGLWARIGPAVAGGVVDGATAVPAPRDAPTTSAFRTSTVKTFKASVAALVFTQRISDAAAHERAMTARDDAGRAVRFGRVTVRDYAMTLGDNPCVRRGHPVCLGWRYDEFAPIPVDEFEGNRPARRPLALLRMSPERRLDYLRNVCEVPWKDLKAARLEVVRTQKRWKKINEEAYPSPKKAKRAGQLCCVVS